MFFFFIDSIYLKGCIINGLIESDCIVDPCSFHINSNECILKTNEWCIWTEEDVCRTAETCSEYTKEYIKLCEEVPGCAVFAGGVCSVHPCFNYPSPDENNICPSGCYIPLTNNIIQKTNMNSIFIDMKPKETNMESIFEDDENGETNENDFDCSDNICEKGMRRDIKKLKMIMCDVEELEIKEMRETIKRCVLDECGRYDNKTCITHTKEKCIPMEEGCR
jgi:hypothetical protein